MRTSIELDDEKVALARKLSPQPSLKKLIDASLEAYIRWAQRENLANMMGTGFFDGDLNTMRGRNAVGRRSRR